MLLRPGRPSHQPNGTERQLYAAQMHQSHVKDHWKSAQSLAVCYLCSLCTRMKEDNLMENPMLKSMLSSRLRMAKRGVDFEGGSRHDRNCPTPQGSQ